MLLGLAFYPQSPHIPAEHPGYAGRERTAARPQDRKLAGGEAELLLGARHAADGVIIPCASSAPSQLLTYQQLVA